MSSLFNAIIETTREAAANDSDFYKSLVYYFELRIPSAAAAPFKSTFFFPLVLNPDSYTMSEPFAAEVTYTEGAGVFVEENGIMARAIRLRGQTGFRPRKIPGGYQPTQLATLKATQKSFSRSLSSVQLVALSGHMHFMYLQDAVFRTYADFKRDPATAQDTKLIFHNLKDQEHWLVIPRAFNLERNAKNPTQYRYDIDLLAVDKAEAAKVDFSEDLGLFDTIRNVLGTINSFVDMASGALHDLTALAGELQGLVKGVGTIIDNVSGIVDAARDFATGVTELIHSPRALLDSVNALIDNGLNFYHSLADDQQIIPAPTLQALHQLSDALNLLGTHPEAFETRAQAQLRAIKASQQIATANSAAALAAAAAAAAPSTFTAVNNLGTALLPGDLSRAKAQTVAGASLAAFTGSQQHTVAKGDTLANLAARYLGDARQWQYLAALNGLKPPFVDAQASTPVATLTDEAQGGAVGLGATIRIPNFSKPPQAMPLLPVLGVRSEESAEVHLLGRDLMLAPRGVTNATDTTLTGSNRDQMDLVIDVEGGGSDIKRVSGRDNLAQALMTRMLTERGTDVLYQNVGIDRIVSLGFAPVDSQVAKFRIQEAIAADPRVASVQSITFEQDPLQSDLINIDLTVAVRGFTEATSVKVAV